MSFLYAVSQSNFLNQLDISKACEFFLIPLAACAMAIGNKEQVCLISDEKRNARGSCTCLGLLPPPQNIGLLANWQAINSEISLYELVSPLVAEQFNASPAVKRIMNDAAAKAVSTPPTPYSRR